MRKATTALVLRRLMAQWWGAVLPTITGKSHNHGEHRTEVAGATELLWGSFQSGRMGEGRVPPEPADGEELTRPKEEAPAVMTPGQTRSRGAGLEKSRGVGSLQTLEVLHAEKGIGLFSVISKGKIRTFEVPRMATSERQILL